MLDILKEADARMQAAIEVLTREFAGVRTGRASTGLLEGIRVDYYGTPTPVAQVAALSVPDPKTLVIQPWDMSQLPAIEKAIMKSDLGLTPVNDGKVIRLILPPLTEERRRQLAKAVGKLAEDTRVAIRSIRREANEKLRAREKKERKISEDESRRGQEQVQKTTDRFIQRVDELLKKKEEEILAF
jgi:ribosome recycling factor